VENVARPGSFAIAGASIYVDTGDYAGVSRAAGDLRTDIERVTGRAPALTHDETGTRHIYVGTLGKSRLIDRWAREGKIEAGRIRGKWESFLIQVTPDGLVIAGSDKRGTIYGIYDLSEQIGVSPWYWWADVPVRHRNALFVKPGVYVQGEPAVKYRGIFLNDEAPALTGWTKEKFGGYNHEFYVKVFELILRLKGNYLWPAMWGSAFNEDDPLNPKLAEDYGIVMGTSHHEPMLRAQQEWKRHGVGPWDYLKNGEELRNFWAEGVERNRNYESIVTIGMRGDGDLPMAPGGDMAANVALLERIVADQRQILAQHVNSDVTKVPQIWALYKEVQEYYEKGMRVPDDVTLLWSDDNWGNLRRVPTDDERSRAGGAGVYYHFDYVGGPRSYKWLNTIPITKVWEQMDLAYGYGARRIWIVNVGDLKPMEFPIEFFLSMAWDPQRWPYEKIAEFTRLWAEREFGREHAAEIADVVAKYTKYNGRRKPELLEPTTFSLENYGEADRVVAEWRALTAQAERIYGELPENARDSFFELVLYPVKASAQVTELYVTSGKNAVYAMQGRSATNRLAERARELFAADAELAGQYNRTLAHGKWNHLMDQTHIGYTNWQEPPANKMPVVTEIPVPVDASMGVAAETPVLAFDAFNRPRRYIDVFNRGRGAFAFAASASDPWIVLSKTQGRVEEEERLWVSIDWGRAPRGKAAGSVAVNGVSVRVEISNPTDVTRDSLKGFVEADGLVSMESEHYTAKVDAGEVHWGKIEDYGRTLSSMTVFPVTAKNTSLSARLEYRMYLFDSGPAEVTAILAPTLSFLPGRGLRYAVSFDDEQPQVIDALAGESQRSWETAVKDSVRQVRSKHVVAAPGYHTLKFWAVDPGVVLQKLVVDLGGVKPSYLGPPESWRQ
jgi:hypothetical protein